MAALHDRDVADANGSWRIGASSRDWAAADRARAEQLDESAVCQCPRARDRDAQVESRLVHHGAADVPVRTLGTSIPCAAVVEDHDGASGVRHSARHRDSHVANAHLALS